MASTAKAGQTARHKARERRIALEAEAKARNDRIENWTAAVFTGVEDRRRALQAAAEAEDAMADGLIGLAGEGLMTPTIAELCEMTAGEVHKLIKRRRASGVAEQPAIPMGVSGGMGASPAAGRSTVDDRATSATPTRPSRESGFGATDE